MKKGIATIALLVFAVVAISISAEQLNDQTFALANVRNHPQPSARLFIETSSLRPSLATHTNKLPSAIALAEGACGSQDLFSSRRSFDNDRAAQVETATRSGPSDRAPPALLPFQS